MAEAEPVRKHVEQALEALSGVLLGKEKQIRLALTCLLAQGHLLIEDVPGMGKTTLAHALARVLGVADTRIQFTSDMLPADIIGVSVFDANDSRFRFHPGPVFTQLLLADEINRATPKTQSALLEAMEEGQVSVDGERFTLPTPFFVIATQNPSSQFGTFPLPESQLDRFLMRITLGYPAPEVERQLLAGGGTHLQARQLAQCLTPEQLLQAQAACRQVHASSSLIGYVQRLLQHTRDAVGFSYGVSPRGGLALLRCARTWAWLAGRDHVVPEDVQAVLDAVVGHRIRSADDLAGHEGDRLVAQLLAEVDVIGQ
ncbi:MAG: MoxR family ATPase [Oceanospirillales bacterium]|uniref:MoxR-like ATPase n=1 Tax=Marinobacterium halophilum TaxID=267374 RepID=A0A2P8EUW0_9GAMM|nr:MoxR family ATPase [Marinobacterium halophilum]MBR9827332.1 MoxR family ATPase [Oceanospirillales bacterium]PSL13244.1 MoxR-like ATPase [Marinobacterium halophilum]